MSRRRGSHAVIEAALMPIPKTVKPRTPYRWFILVVGMVQLVGCWMVIGDHFLADGFDRPFRLLGYAILSLTGVGMIASACRDDRPSE